jgi:hypothetical protein
VSPRTGVDDVERRKILLLPGLNLRTLGRPASSQSLYRLRYPGSRQRNLILKNVHWSRWSDLQLKWKSTRHILNKSALAKPRHYDRIGNKLLFCMEKSTSIPQAEELQFFVFRGYLFNMQISYVPAGHSLIHMTEPTPANTFKSSRLYCSISSHSSSQNTLSEVALPEAASVMGTGSESSLFVGYLTALHRLQRLHAMRREGDNSRWIRKVRRGNGPGLLQKY